MVRRVFGIATRFAVFWSILNGLPVCAQTPAAAPATAPGTSLEDSVRALAVEVKNLNATVQDLRAEVSRSRQETSELRTELSAALERLSPASRTASVAVSGASPASPATLPENRPSQASAVRPRNSAEERLTRLEEDQELLQAKVDEQHQTKVESQSKYRVKLNGIALLNLFGNSGTVNNQDVPGLAVPPGPTSTSGSVGATVRQSELGVEVFGPTLAGAQASGSVDFDFFGGFASGPNGVTENLVRLRTAVMRLDWSRTSLIGGQDAPFFSPLSPTSFASLGYPALADAGNLWTWTPQLRVEHRFQTSEASQLILQTGVLDPLTGEPPYSEYYRTPSGGEQSRKPAVGSRVSWTHGAADHALTLGVGGYYSRQNFGAGRTVDSWAGMADWNLPVGNHFAFSGEFYRGRAIGGLGAAEGRSVLFDGPALNPASDIQALNTMGGWAQFKFRVNQKVEFNTAYGQDDPFSTDLHYFNQPISYAYASIAKNQNGFVNVIYRPRGDLLFALEYRFLDTLQITNQANKAGTVNASIGVLF